MDSLRKAKCIGMRVQETEIKQIDNSTRQNLFIKIKNKDNDKQMSIQRGNREVDSCSLLDILMLANQPLWIQSVNQSVCRG